MNNTSSAHRAARSGSRSSPSNVSQYATAFFSSLFFLGGSALPRPRPTFSAPALRRRRSPPVSRQWRTPVIERCRRDGSYSSVLIFGGICRWPRTVGAAAEPAPRPMDGTCSGWEFRSCLTSIFALPRSRRSIERFHGRICKTRSFTVALIERIRTDLKNDPYYEQNFPNEG